MFRSLTAIAIIVLAVGVFAGRLVLFAMALAALLYGYEPKESVLTACILFAGSGVFNGASSSSSKEKQ